MKHIREILGHKIRFTLINDSSRVAISLDLDNRVTNLHYHLDPKLATKIYDAKYLDIPAMTHEGCEYLNEKPCVCDGRLLGEELCEQWKSQGDQVIWSELGYEMAIMHQRCFG